MADYEDDFGPIRVTSQALDAAKRAELKGAFVDWVSQFQIGLWIAILMQFPDALINFLSCALTITSDHRARSLINTLAAAPPCPSSNLGGAAKLGVILPQASVYVR